MSTKTTKKATTRKAQPKKAQPEVTPIPKRARGASKVAEAAARRPVPQPPASKGKLEVFDALMAPIVGKGKTAKSVDLLADPTPRPKSGKRVSGDAIPTVDGIATMTAPDRIKAAKAEHASLREWAANGKKGDKPTTPVLDWLGENPSGSVQRKRAVRKAKGTNGVGRSGVCTVVYFHDGVQQGERYNSLSNLAYYTGGKGTRLTSGELRTLLAKNGIDSPETTAWEFTAPNGTKLSAKLA